MMSFLRSTHAQETAAHRNLGVQERRARLMQLGERAYVCQTLAAAAAASCTKKEELRLQLVDLPELELRQYLSSSDKPPSRADLAAALQQFVAHCNNSSSNNNRSAHSTLEISQRIQELLHEVSRPSFYDMLTVMGNLRHVSLGTISVDILQRLQASARRVESLHTECFHVHAPHEEDVMVQLLSDWKSLQFLSWKTSSYRRAMQIRILAAVVPSLPRLQRLHLGHTGLKEFHPFEALQPLVQECVSLQELVLQNWKLSTQACAVLAGGMAEHPTLQRVRLLRCEILQRGWEYLLQALQDGGPKGPQIREFSFGETRIVRSASASAKGHSRAGGTFPSRLVWERLAVILQDHNHTLQHIANVNTLRVWRLLQLNQSNFRQHLDSDAQKLAPFILAMASHSPRFVYSMLRNNVEPIFLGGTKITNYDC